MKKISVLTLIGVAIGGVLGFLYWKFVGCASGACAITSKPLNSSLYGMLMGGLLFSNFNNLKKQKNDNDERNHSGSQP
jgi:hypothetical protein